MVEKSLTKQHCIVFTKPKMYSLLFKNRRKVKQRIGKKKTAELYIFYQDIMFRGI